MTETDLKSAADLVAYEIRMLRFTWKVLTRKRDVRNGEAKSPYAASSEFIGSGASEDGDSGPPYDTETWVYLESFLIHARCLRDFLIKRSSSNDDVLATQYYSDPKMWQSSLAATHCTYLVGEYQKSRLDKSLAHISYRRLAFEIEGKLWNVDAIFAELTAAWADFLSRIPEERRSWFWMADEPLDDEL